MTPKNKAASLVAQGDGEVTSISLATGTYLTPNLSATDLAAAIIGARFGLSACVARLVVQLAGIGGRASA